MCDQILRALINMSLDKYSAVVACLSWVWVDLLCSKINAFKFILIEHGQVHLCHDLVSILKFQVPSSKIIQFYNRASARRLQLNWKNASKIRILIKLKTRPLSSTILSIGRVSAS